MGIRIVDFAPEHLQAVAGFSERYWSRPRKESYYRWRYLESAPFTRMVVALDDDGSCLATVSALRKTYRAGEREVPMLEVFDWHCLPQLRAMGVGIRVMKAMMQKGEPLLAVGGTNDSMSTLAALKWLRIGPARRFLLPLSGQVVMEALGRRSKIPIRLPRALLDPIVKAWYGPERRGRSNEGSVLLVGSPGNEVIDLYRGPMTYDLAQVPDLLLLRWMTASYPGNGHFFPLVFIEGQRVRGWTLSRVYQDARGTEADILDAFAPTPDAGTYHWMISESVRVLSAFDPRSVRARATCPLLQEALRRSRFREDQEGCPAHLWPASWLESPRAIHVTLNHADEPLRPYPSTTAGTGYLVS